MGIQVQSFSIRKQHSSARSRLPGAPADTHRQMRTAIPHQSPPGPPGGATVRSTQVEPVSVQSLVVRQSTCRSSLTRLGQRVSSHCTAGCEPTAVGAGLTQAGIEELTARRDRRAGTSPTAV